MTERLYHIVRVNDRTGERIRLTGYPMPHADCMVMMGKLIDIRRYPQLRHVLEEVTK